jgi:hypothetical protein
MISVAPNPNGMRKIRGRMKLITKRYWPHGLHKAASQSLRVVADCPVRTWRGKTSDRYLVIIAFDGLQG